MKTGITITVLYISLITGVYSSRGEESILTFYSKAAAKIQSPPDEAYLYVVCREKIDNLYVTFVGLETGKVLLAARCDSGAFESQPTASVTITKVTDPSGGTGFGFESDGFGSLQGCGLRGEGGDFVMNDGDSVNCIVPEGDYSITENIPPGYELIIFCLEAPDNLTINNETGEIEYTIEGPGADVDCVYTNTRTGVGGNGGCSLAPAGANNSFPLYLLIPVLIIVRGMYKKCRG